MRKYSVQFGSIFTLLSCSAVLIMGIGHASPSNWEIGPFARVESANPILIPSSLSTFVCPVQGKK